MIILPGDGGDGGGEKAVVGRLQEKMEGGRTVTQATLQQLLVSVDAQPPLASTTVE